MKRRARSRAPLSRARLRAAARDLRIGRNTRILAKRIRIGRGVVVDENVLIEADDLNLEDGARIGARVTIRADRFTLGFGSRIDSECVFGYLNGRAREVSIGDYCYIGGQGIFSTPVLVTGDYLKLHHHAMVNGHRPCCIGHNVWIGQNCILNAEAHLCIGNNVGIGPYNTLYTHAYYGEHLEGCRIHKVAPITVQDGAWIGGSFSVVSPGVTIGKCAVVLTSSAVSRDVLPAHCVGGHPARDVTFGAEPYQELTPEAKLDMMRSFIREYVTQIHPGRFKEYDHGFLVEPEGMEPFKVLVVEEMGAASWTSREIVLLYARRYGIVREFPRVTLFDLSSKQYTKRRTQPEIQIIQFMNNFRARFVPTSRATVCPGMDEQGRPLHSSDPVP